MSKDYGYVSLPDMQYLMVGLAINVKRCADVLDGVLTAFNQKMGIPDQIVAWNVKGGNAAGPLSFPDRGRFIIELTQSVQSGGQELWTAALLEKHNEKEKAPVVFIRMHSPSLDIPMRLEIPWRAMMKGGPPLEGTYCVYLHALLVDDGTEFVYYGITKRGWNLRFAEHTRAAVAEKSRRFGQSQPQMHISKEGDPYLRTLLVQGAQHILGPFGVDCDLRRWGLKLAERGGKSGKKRAIIATARKLAVLLHHLWVSGEAYEPLHNSRRRPLAIAA